MDSKNFNQEQGNDTEVERQASLSPNRKTNKKKQASPATIVLAIVCFILLCSNVAWIVLFATSSFLGDGKKDVDSKKLGQIRQALDEYYYEDFNPQDLVEGAYKGYVDGVGDPYTTYYTKEEYEELVMQQQGSFYGIGAGLLKDEETGLVKISMVYDGSPAKEAGLREGDFLVSADGQLSADMEVSDFAAIVRGKEGTTVVIVYRRDGKDHTVSIVRRKIEMPSVSYELLEDQVGYLKISEFVENTDEEFNDALASLQEQGMEKLLIDLRANPGGLVDATVSILDQILPEGTVVYTEDKNGKRRDYKSDDAHQLQLPIAVLIDEDSASASEIFAGAIRDYEAGTLVGKNTYGKGIVQSFVQLSDGSAMKITFAAYYSPKGENIHKKGIAPDVEVDYEYTGDLDADYDYHFDMQLQKALFVLK